MKLRLFHFNELVYVATIASPVELGVSSLAGYTEEQIDEFRKVFEIEIRKVKNSIRAQINEASPHKANT